MKITGIEPITCESGIGGRDGQHGHAHGRAPSACAKVINRPRGKRVVPGGKVRGEGTVLDLSMGGCIIKSETQVHTDDIFYLQLSLDESEPPLEVAGMVRSVSPRGIAFKFLRAAQENKRLLAFVQAQIPDQPDKSSVKVSVPA